LTRLSNLCEGRVDGEPRGGQGRNRLNFDEESLTSQTSLESRAGGERRLYMTSIDLIVLPTSMPVGECHLGLHQVSQRTTSFLQCDGHIGKGLGGLDTHIAAPHQIAVLVLRREAAQEEEIPHQNAALGVWATQWGQGIGDNEAFGLIDYGNGLDLDE